MKKGIWVPFLLLGICGLMAGDPLLDDLGLHSEMARRSEQTSCAPLPPPPSPAHHSSAEGMPPLPLPAVSLRRTEKKSPPRPPVLVAKVATTHQQDWNTNPGDVQNLLKWMARTMNVHFSDMVLPSGQLPQNAGKLPVLYRTGHEAFAFTQEERERIAAYLRGGGTLVFEACCGHADFVESALKEMRLILPERSPHRLSAEHPLFHAYYDMVQFEYRPEARQAGARPEDPAVLGVDLGCRTAIFLFRWDVSCGWDAQHSSPTHLCLGYELETARKLGANLLSYVTSEHSVAMPLSQAMVFEDARPNLSGTLALAQVKYGGTWKTREAGLSMLLHTFHQQTKIPVSFSRKEISLTSQELADYPVLYLCGHDDFVLSMDELVGLRRYLKQGGVLFAESCCGRMEFTKAFLQEMRRAFPDCRLERVPLTDPLFQYPARIQQLRVRSHLAVQAGSQEIAPVIYRLMLDDRCAVLFSPYGLSCGWELAQCPYCRGYADADALKLGLNLLSFILMR